MATPPFRFSLQVARSGSRREWVDLVRRVDDAGFDLLVTADHLGGAMAPIVPLAVAAEVSGRLRLGVMVLNNDFHHPALLARDVATLDLLSDGRVEVGLGAGHSWPEYARAGLPFEAPGRRVDRLEEAVGILRRLLDGETVTFRGEHYHLEGERTDPRPVQPHVPLLVGGSGRRVHRIAARHADAIGFTGLGAIEDDGLHAAPSGFPVAAVDEDVAATRIVEAERDRPVEHQVLVQAVVLSRHPTAAAEDLVRDRLPSLTPAEVLATPYLLVGTTGSLVDRLLEHRERWGFSHYTVRPEALGQLEPVIAALAGR